MNSDNSTFLAQADPILDRLIRQLPQPVIPSTENVFHDLMSCVLEQQIHYRSTKKTFQKMLNAAQIQRLTLDNFHEFEQHSFSNIKLSGSKYETIAGIVEFWEVNKVDWTILSDEAIRQTLATIKGIGPWTIDMILLYTLQRPSIFPSNDFHLKQIMVALYQLDPKSKLKAQMTAIAENWGYQKSLAVLYLLAWKQLNKK